MAADVFPDREGLVIRVGEGDDGERSSFDGRPFGPPQDELGDASADGEGGKSLVVESMRWGFPPPPNAGAYYVTNVRNVASGFWKPWLKVEASLPRAGGAVCGA